MKTQTIPARPSQPRASAIPASLLTTLGFKQKAYFEKQFQKQHPQEYDAIEKTYLTKYSEALQKCSKILTDSQINAREFSNQVEKDIKEAEAKLLLEKKQREAKQHEKSLEEAVAKVKTELEEKHRAELAQQAVTLKRRYEEMVIRPTHQRKTRRQGHFLQT